MTAVGRQALKKTTINYFPESLQFPGRVLQSPKPNLSSDRQCKLCQHYKWAYNSQICYDRSLDVSILWKRNINMDLGFSVFHQENGTNDSSIKVYCCPVSCAKPIWLAPHKLFHRDGLICLFSTPSQCHEKPIEYWSQIIFLNSRFFRTLLSHGDRERLLSCGLEHFNYRSSNQFQTLNAVLLPKVLNHKTVSIVQLLHLSTRNTAYGTTRQSQWWNTVDKCLNLNEIDKFWINEQGKSSQLFTILRSAALSVSAFRVHDTMSAVRNPNFSSTVDSVQTPGAPFHGSTIAFSSKRTIFMVAFCLTINKILFSIRYDTASKKHVTFSHDSAFLVQPDDIWTSLKNCLYLLHGIERHTLRKLWALILLLQGGWLKFQFALFHSVTTTQNFFHCFVQWRYPIWII